MDFKCENDEGERQFIYVNYFNNKFLFNHYVSDKSLII